MPMWCAGSQPLLPTPCTQVAPWLYSYMPFTVTSPGPKIEWTTGLVVSLGSQDQYIIAVLRMVRHNGCTAGGVTQCLTYWYSVDAGWFTWPPTLPKRCRSFAEHEYSQVLSRSISNEVVAYSRCPDAPYAIAADVMANFSCLCWVCEPLPLVCLLSMPWIHAGAQMRIRLPSSSIVLGTM